MFLDNIIYPGTVLSMQEPAVVHVFLHFEKYCSYFMVKKEMSGIREKCSHGKMRTQFFFLYGYLFSHFECLLDNPHISHTGAILRISDNTFTIAIENLNRRMNSISD